MNEETKMKRIVSTGQGQQAILLDEAVIYGKVCLVHF